MNMDQYKKSMLEIEVKKIKIEELLNKKTKRVNKLRTVKFIPILFGIVLTLFFIDFSKKSPEIIINVYAAENEITLTKDFVNFELNAMPLIGASTLDKQGHESDSFVNYNINFICKDENIKTITYTCTNQVVTRNNRLDADAYYVENIRMPIEEYTKLDLSQEDNFIFSYHEQGETTENITKLIGNSYTVSYAEQTNKQYGLVIAATTDEDGNYYVNDIIIKVDIEMEDGSVQHKKILIKPLSDAFSEFQIRVL
ncbi:MAG: hypothetical protein WCD89_15480 [Anaerocolumna sp.]